MKIKKIIIVSVMLLTFIVGVSLRAQAVQPDSSQSNQATTVKQVETEESYIKARKNNLRQRNQVNQRATDNIEETTPCPYYCNCPYDGVRQNQECSYDYDCPNNHRRLYNQTESKNKQVTRNNQQKQHRKHC